MEEASRNISQVIRSLNMLIGRGEKVCGKEKLKVGSAMLIERRGVQEVMKQVLWLTSIKEDALFFLFKNFNLSFILYWSIVDLQCCVSFRCTAK